MSIFFVVGATNLIELPNLQDTTDGSYPANATVIADVFAPGASTPITGGAGLPMTLVPAPAGAQPKYRGVLPANVPLIAGAVYTVRATCTDASSNVRPLYLDVPAIRG